LFQRSAYRFDGVIVRLPERWRCDDKGQDGAGGKSLFHVSISFDDRPRVRRCGTRHERTCLEFTHSGITPARKPCQCTDDITRYPLSSVVAVSKEGIGMMERRTTKIVFMILNSAFYCRSALSTVNVRAIMRVAYSDGASLCRLAQSPHFD
jgi:hypothetical protein